MLNAHTQPPTRAQIYRQIIVTFARAKSFADARKDLRSALHSARVEFRSVDTNEQLHAELIELAPDEDVARVCEDLVNAGAVEAAEPNRLLRPAAVVNDLLYPQQWALSRIGADTAWLHVRSLGGVAGPGVVVAVVDTGIHIAHQDLAGHIWDDGAGHHGFNIINGSYDVSDADGHGTELAGTIGAVSNNALGIAAAEWPLRLMAIKFLDIRHAPHAWTGAVAIAMAAVAGADVINASWGVGVPFDVLRNAIRFANAHGVVVVAAAGNDGLDNDLLGTYPASYVAGPPDLCPNLISVMASNRVSRMAPDRPNPCDDKAWFSNYGRTRVHLAAPGVGILTTASSFGNPPRWRVYSGTSAACAYVTYAAALIKSLNPTWTPTEIRNHVINSVDPSPWLRCVSRGRLSLARAVCGPFTVTSPAAGAQWSAAQNATITWTNGYVTGRPTTKVTIEMSRDGGPYAAIALSQPNNEACVVTAPNAAVNAARLRIRSDEAPGLYAESGVFSVRVAS
jgi:subtilisin family serine protease